MASPGSARHKRLEAVREHTERAIDWRLHWREQAAACTAIRAALEAAGIDPAGVSCLTLGPDAARMLAERGETPEREAADAAYAAEFLPARDTMARRAAEREPRWAAGDMPFAGDPILDWLAWASVRGRMPADAGNSARPPGEAGATPADPWDDESEPWEEDDAEEALSGTAGDL